MHALLQALCYAVASQCYKQPAVQKSAITHLLKYVMPPHHWYHTTCMHAHSITVWLEKHVQVQERNSRTGKFQRLTNWYGGSRQRYGAPPAAAHPAPPADVGSVTWLCDWLCTVGEHTALLTVTLLVTVLPLLRYRCLCRHGLRFWCLHSHSTLHSSKSQQMLCACTVKASSA
jgi:hypothetical protein